MREMNRDNVIEKIKGVIEVLKYVDPIINTEKFITDMRKILGRFRRMIETEGLKRWV